VASPIPIILEVKSDVKSALLKLKSFMEMELVNNRGGDAVFWLNDCKLKIRSSTQIPYFMFCRKTNLMLHDNNHLNGYLNIYLLLP
jgi:hypothetical protein